MPKPSDVPFVDATDALGIDAEHHFATDFCEIADSVGGPGVCALDYDADGDLDLYFTDRAPYPNRLFRNDGDRFSDVTEVSGAGTTADSMGCLAFDADSDGDVDLYVTNNGPDQLFRNDGGRFVDVTAEAGIDAPGMSTSATAGDIDLDGDLDLFVGRLVVTEECPADQCHLLPLACPALRNLLFINEGGRFVEQAVARGITEVEPTLAALFFDRDDDGDLDLYVGNDMGVAYPDRLYENDGTGHFTERGMELGFDAWGTDTMGVDVGDLDGDGLAEVVTSDFKDKPLRVHDCYDPSHELACSFEHLGPESLPHVKWAVALEDFDQDGDLDLFWTNGDVYYRDGDPNQLVWSEGGGQFTFYTPSPGEALAAVAVSRGAALGDLDGDGDVDVAVANAGGRAQVLLNQAARGRWLSVELDSLSAGARVTARVDGRALTEQALIGGGYLGSSAPALHFGLGEACAADVTITWPGGATRRFDAVPAGRAFRIAR
jgi:hypothetical protein